MSEEPDWLDDGRGLMHILVRTPPGSNAAELITLAKKYHCHVEYLPDIVDVAVVE